MFAAYITVYIIEISSGFRAKPQVFIYVFLGYIPMFTGHIPEFYGHIMASLHQLCRPARGPEARWTGQKWGLKIGFLKWVWINTYKNTIFRGMNIHVIPAILM